MKLLTLLLCICVVSTKDEFDPTKHIFYEMHCQFFNQTENFKSSDFDVNVLKHENLIYGTNRTVIGVQNCRWNWKDSRPTRIFIHGYFSTPDTFKQYTKAYLERRDYNFIVINWLKGALTINYNKARKRVNEVGDAVAKFVDYLVSIGLNLDELILVGHSLGE